MNPSNASRLAVILTDPRVVGPEPVKAVPAAASAEGEQCFELRAVEGPEKRQTIAAPASAGASKPARSRR